MGGTPGRHNLSIGIPVSSSFAVNKGKIIIYRIFDVGNEIDLEKASLTIEQSMAPLRFKLKKISKAIVINNAPLTLSLGGWQYEEKGQIFEAEVVGKIWYFGSISIAFHLNIPVGTDLEKLSIVASAIESDPQFNDYASQKLKEIISQISNCIDKMEIWNTFEDYMVYFIDSYSGIDTPVEILKHGQFYSLILADNIDRPADAIVKSITENIFQYSINDLAIIEWNSAFIIEPSGSLDICDVIEFSLCQLLEMRYYDDLLDNKLNYLYSSIIDDKGGVLSDRYSTISKEAAQKYLELSEIVENIENSLKIIGDYYYARIYRAASLRFRIKDWQASVDNKLSNLAEVSKLLHAEVSEKRSALLEIIIILLIAVELIPLIWKLLSHS